MEVISDPKTNPIIIMENGTLSYASIVDVAQQIDTTIVAEEVQTIVEIDSEPVGENNHEGIKTTENLHIEQEGNHSTVLDVYCVICRKGLRSLVDPWSEVGECRSGSSSKTMEELVGLLIGSQAPVNFDVSEFLGRCIFKRSFGL